MIAYSVRTYIASCSVAFSSGLVDCAQVVQHAYTYDNYMRARCIIFFLSRALKVYLTLQPP